MSVWSVVFYPKSGERHSPYDFIKSIPNKDDQVRITRWLVQLSQSEYGDWPFTKIHKLTGKIFQLTVGKYRVMYTLDDRVIVVLHCCRKVSRKTKPKDLQRAEKNYEAYFATKGKM